LCKSIIQLLMGLAEALPGPGVKEQPVLVEGQYYRGGLNQWSSYAVAGYVLYLFWCVLDTLFSHPVKVKYLFQEPITKLWVDIGYPIAMFLVPYTWITPNMISYFHVCLGFVSFLLVSSKNWNHRRLGVVIYAIRSILDSTDGALARARALQGLWTIHSDAVIDVDFVCDTASTIMYGAGIVVYFWRYETEVFEREMSNSYAFKIFASCVFSVFLKGFIMDSLIETYEESGIEPSLLVAFLWKISSYDSWDNLKLFALLSVTEYHFFIFWGFFGIPWVAVPTVLSLLEIYAIF
jgi:hypothetical protein